MGAGSVSKNGKRSLCGKKWGRAIPCGRKSMSKDKVERLHMTSLKDGQ